MVTDEKIYKNILNGDPKSLDALIDTYSGEVYRLVYQILKDTGNRQDIEECCSDSFLDCWNNIHQYKPELAPFKTFVLMKAKYIALERRRKLSRKKTIYSFESLAEKGVADESNALPENKLVEKEQRQCIQQALQKLSPLDKKLVYKRYFLHEEISDLAAENNLSREAVDTRLWRARKFLKSYLQKHHAADGNFKKKGGCRNNE